MFDLFGSRRGAGFLNGPGFEKMRDDLRRTCSDIWVIDCSPAGHQPDVSTRIFQRFNIPSASPLRHGTREVSCAAERQARGQVRRARGFVPRREGLGRREAASKRPNR